MHITLLYRGTLSFLSYSSSSSFIHFEEELLYLRACPRTAMWRSITVKSSSSANAITRKAAALAYVQWFNLQSVKARSGESLPVIDLTKKTRSQLGATWLIIELYSKIAHSLDKLLCLSQVAAKVCLLPKKLVQKRIGNGGGEVYFVLERSRSSVLFNAK